MTKYMVKSAKGYWLPGAAGYTQSEAEAGVWTLAELATKAWNLDGCSLVRVGGAA